MPPRAKNEGEFQNITLKLRILPIAYIKSENPSRIKKLAPAKRDNFQMDGLRKIVTLE